MKVPVSWLKEFVDAGIAPAEIAHRLTMAGIEVEAIVEIGARNASVVVGKLVEKKELALPGGRRGWLLSLDAGKPITCLSLAPQLAEAGPDTLMAVALEGSVLFDPDAGLAATRVVERVERYGHVSNAVLCSAAELGVGSDHTGILLLQGSPAPGSPVAALFDGGDVILEPAILANIARCQSMLGIAREVSALTRAPFRDPRQFDRFEAAPGELSPAIEAKAACPRLTLTLIEGVTVTESPEWLRRRLVLAGVTPINNVVDASNYVMLEMGQPTHAYSADKLPSLSLHVRLSRKGETIRTLAQGDEEPPLALPGGIPLITSADKPVAVAGIVGGFDTRVTAETNRILLEAASFDMFAIRRSQVELKAYTEASARFSRGVDRNSPYPAAERLLNILRLTSPGAKVVATAEAVVPGAIPDVREIELTVSEVNRSLGTRLSAAEVREPLEVLGLAVAGEGETLRVKIGSDREDLNEPCDLLEEIARVRGYDLLESTMPVEPVPLHAFDAPLHARERARDAMVQAGLQETINYTLTSLEATQALSRGSSQASGPVVTLLNPVSVERAVVRRSLLPGLLEVYARNRRQRAGCRIFELGTVALPELAPAGGSLPFEGVRLCILVGGPSAEPTLHEPNVRQHDFFDLKAIVDRLLAALKLDDAVYEPGALHPIVGSAGARLRVGNAYYGDVGLLHPLVAEAFKLKDDQLFCADLDLDGLSRIAKRVAAYREILRFPSIELDIAAIFAQHVSAQQILELARSSGGSLLRRVRIFDVYSGAPIPEKHKNVGLRLDFAAGDRTLQMEEAFALRGNVADALRKSLGATIRE